MKALFVRTEGFGFLFLCIVLVLQLCPILWDPMDYSSTGSSVHGISQARIVKWVAIPFSRGSSWPRDRTWVSCITGRFFTIWAIREFLHVIFMLNSTTMTPWNPGLSHFFFFGGVGLSHFCHSHTPFSLTWKFF